MPAFQDLTGRTFGRLTVIERAEGRYTSRGSPVVRWRCRCNCGNEMVTDAVCLTAGHTKSCGCLQDESRRKSKNRRSNKYEEQNDYVVGYTSSGTPFYIDREDYEKVRHYCWWVGTKDGYLRARLYESDEMVLLHRFVMGLPDLSLCVDHINHDPSDNRKCNLRLVTVTQNQLNRAIPINNKSGVPGVRWESKPGKWSAHIKDQGKNRSLGHFDSFDDAVAAREDAEQIIYGEYSYDNSIAAVPRITV